MSKRFVTIVLVSGCVLMALFSTAQPAGTVKLSEGKYFEATEVDIGAWLSYYSWMLENEGYFAALKVLPDSNSLDPDVWKFITTKTAVYNERLASTGLPIGFFSKECKGSIKYGQRLSSVPGDCAYVSLPITGITFEQAVAYCEWKTMVQGKGNVVYRLPTNEEWKRIALGGLREHERAKGLRDSLNAKNCSLFNYKMATTCQKGSFQGVSGIALFEPLRNGAYDVFGNVSEMTASKGHSKGGNFTKYAIKSHPDSVQYYVKPESWLGFRCIAVIGNTSDTINSTKQLKEAEVVASGNLAEYIDTRDGKKYLTVRIGNQTWFAENLKYKPAEGKFWLPEKDEKNVSRYGYLYSYETAQNVCPEGWSLPMKGDFETLLNQELVKGLVENLMPSGASNFDALLGGTHIGVNYVPAGYATLFWTTTANTDKKIWVMSIGSDNPNAKIIELPKKSSFGFPVRCIKD